MSLQRAQRGQGGVEFVVIFLTFAALILGLFEMTRVFRAKHLLNTATFAAARAGTVHNARVAPMNGELANGMVPMYMQGDRSVAGLTAALTRAQAMVALPGLGVQIVSPTGAIFDQLKKEQRIRRTDEDEYRWQDVIPNDNLRWRPRDTATIGSGEINLQDANLLKVRTLWCHRLIVPALDGVIYGIVNLPMFVGDRQLVCSGISDGAVPGIARGFYLAITADATLRMQSPVVEDDLP